MSTPSTPGGRTALVVGIVAIFVFTVAGVVAIAVAVPEGGNPGSLIALLLGSLAPTIAAVVAVAKVAGVDDKVDDLGNGRMDAKIRAGLADVLPPELLRPDVAEQLAVDRARRAAGNHRARRGRPIPVDQPGDGTTTGEDLA